MKDRRYRRRDQSTAIDILPWRVALPCLLALAALSCAYVNRVNDIPPGESWITGRAFLDGEPLVDRNFRIEVKYPTRGGSMGSTGSARTDHDGCFETSFRTLVSGTALRFSLEGAREVETRLWRSTENLEKDIRFKTLSRREVAVFTSENGTPLPQMQVVFHGKWFSAFDKVSRETDCNGEVSLDGLPDRIRGFIRVPDPFSFFGSHMPNFDVNSRTGRTPVRLLLDNVVWLERVSETGEPILGGLVFRLNEGDWQARCMLNWARPRPLPVTCLPNAGSLQIVGFTVGEDPSRPLAFRRIPLDRTASGQVIPIVFTAPRPVAVKIVDSEGNTAPDAFATTDLTIAFRHWIGSRRPYYHDLPPAALGLGMMLSEVLLRRDHDRYVFNKYPNLDVPLFIVSPRGAAVVDPEDLVDGAEVRLRWNHVISGRALWPVDPTRARHCIVTVTLADGSTVRTNTVENGAFAAYVGDSPPPRIEFRTSHPYHAKVLHHPGRGQIGDIHLDPMPTNTTRARIGGPCR